MSNDFPINPSDFNDLSPHDVELQLRWLSREISKAQNESADLEVEYAEKEARLTIAMAKSRIKVGSTSRVDGKNWTEQQKEDLALEENESDYIEVQILTAKVKAARSRNNALITQTDIVRSVSSLMKAGAIQ